MEYAGWRASVTLTPAAGRALVPEHAAEDGVAALESQAGPADHAGVEVALLRQRRPWPGPTWIAASAPCASARSRFPAAR